VVRERPRAGVRAGRRSAEPLHPRDDPTARVVGQKLAKTRRPRRRGKTTGAAVSDLRRSPDLPAEGVALDVAADRRVRGLRPLTRKRGRQREGPCKKIKLAFLPLPTPPPQAGEGADRVCRSAVASSVSPPFIPAKEGIQGQVLGPRFRGDERRECRAQISMDAK